MHIFRFLLPWTHSRQVRKFSYKSLVIAKLYILFIAVLSSVEGFKLTIIHRHAYWKIYKLSKLHFLIKPKIQWAQNGCLYMYLHSNILTMSMLSFYGYGNFLIHFFWADFFFLLINVTKQSFCTIFFTFLLIRTSRAENLWGFSHTVIIPNLGWILTSDGPFKLHITTLLLYEKLTDRGYLIKCFHSFVTIPYEIFF